MTARFAAATAATLIATASAAAAPKGDPSTRSSAITDEIVDAVVKEMERSKRSLVIDGAPSPYFFAYKLTEVEVNDVAASLGYSTDERERHFVNLEAHVHVGDYQRDNSNFVAAESNELDGVVSIPLPLEATPSLARRAAWRTTDAAYKEAIAQLSAKNDALKTGASGGLTDVPSYSKASKAKPEVSLAPVLVPKLESTERLGKRAAKLSAFFRDQPQVRTSRVAFTSFLERRWLINSEGTRVHDTRRVTGVLIAVSGQADDGQELALYYTRYGLTEADLPSDDKLLAEARLLASTIGELASAPLVESYAGPILFEGDAAADVVRHTLARNFSGTPLPVGLAPNDARRFGGGLISRIGLKSAPTWLDVIDDPTTDKAGKRHLIGGYRIDDEGVAPQRVQVVKNGRLTALLMSRTPSARMSESNGHARLAMPGGVFRGSPTNTFINSRRKLSARQLEQKLLATARASGLEYGLIISQFDDPAITANPELGRFEMLSILRTVDPDAPPPALLAYKLLPNGKRQLVRGVQLDAVSTNDWRNLVATGREIRVKNFLASTDDPLLARVQGIDEGFVPSAGVESAVVTPDLLLEELQVKPTTLGRRPPPVLPRP
jgi:predicted Zn-dependent protease